MRTPRVIIELIFFFLALLLLVLGLNVQRVFGLGLIIGSITVAFFAIELFIAQRPQIVQRRAKEDLEQFLWKRLRFDWRNKALCNINNISREDIAALTEWFVIHKEEKEINVKFWRKERLDRFVPIGMSWASGYTPFLDKFARERTEEHLGLDEHFFFRGYKRHINIAERVLAQSGRDNVLLVGEEGVGTSFVLMGLEKLIETGRALPSLAFKRFVWLDTQALLSGIDNPGILRKRLEGVFKDALRAGNIILGIEHFHSLLDPAFPEIPDVLIPFLRSERSQVVATTTPRLYTSYMTSRADLIAEFVNVTVEELSGRNELVALQEVAYHIEERERVMIPYTSLKKVIALATRFSIETSSPQREINLLEEAVSFIKTKNKRVLESPDIMELLTERTGIPMGAFSEDEQGKLLRLESLMHERFVDQDAAVRAISQVLKRARSGVRSPDRPIGSFLFLGPTGVGKTTAAKALAALYFGREDAMIRFDMSEYQNIEDVPRLIDSLGQEVRQHPYTVLLLDEIEKSHVNILNVFLQVLDEGMMTDSKGLHVNFRNLMIIATSNAGSEFIRTHIKEVGSPTFERGLLDYIQKSALFKPEFLNRFDAVVTFKPLGTEELKAIAKLLLQDFASRVRKEHSITITLTDDLIGYLVQKGFDPAYGARPMRRLIQDTIETAVAERIIRGDLQRGDTLSLTSKDLYDTSSY